MSTTVRVNADKVRDAMNRQGLSDRETHKRSGIGQQSARSAVLDGTLHASTPLAKVRAYLDVLGLTWGDLLDDPIPEAPTDSLPAHDREQTLARLLTTKDHAIDLDHLCSVFGITLHELHGHLDNLAPRFAALGFSMKVGNNNAVRLVPATDAAYDDAQVRLTRLRDAAKDLNISAANTLYRAYNGTLSTRGLTNNDQVQLAALTARGALGPPSSNDRTPVTDDTLYCLEPHRTRP